MKNNDELKELNQLQMKTKENIASELGIHPSTLYRKLKNAGIKIPRGYVSPEMQAEIYKIMGWQQS
jgi:DNA invertase Pin-like site-specific DNA recombinase